MGELNEKMTALADAIRSKSGATGKLSIDKMITAVDSIETGGTGGGGDVEYFKCAYVHRSPTETVIEVTGAGYAIVDGRYRKTELLTPFGGEVWQKYKYRDDTWQNYYLYNYADNAWAIGYGYDDTPELFDYYSTNGILGDYSIFVGDTSGGNLPDLSNYTPPPTLSYLTLEIDPDMVKTWDGYKAIWNASLDQFTFSEELTTGLPFGDYFVPEVGKIYPADTRAIVEQLWTRGSDSGDVIGAYFSYYQCTAVYGPRKVDGFIVSGAGNSLVNGNYLPTDLRTEEDTPIYKHETADYYYFEMWGEKGICTSPTDYPGNGLYHNMYDEGWTIGSGGVAPAPSVTTGRITVDADAPKTWNGYGVYWSADEGYKFSETLTANLPYGTGLIPEVGKVYDAQARVEVSKLFEAVKPITTNDTACLIYIDGSSLTNQGKAPDKQDITFGSGVSSNGTLLLTPNDGSGRITTYPKPGGYGGLSNNWVIDICAKSDAQHCYLTGNSNYGWCIQSLYNKAWELRNGPVLMPRDSDYSKLFCISVQYSDGFVHVWNAGKYVGAMAYTINPVTDVEFGIGTDGDPNQNMANSIKLFRFSNKARYTPGVDFELPEGFIG